jgi:hypothetical protein
MGQVLRVVEVFEREKIGRRVHLDPQGLKLS